MRYTLSVLVAVLLSNCEKDERIVDGTLVDLPAVIELHVGESIRLPQDHSIITFEGVTQDSRCPVGAMCLWEGDAATRFTIRGSLSEARDCTLHTTLSPKFINIEHLTLNLKAVAPYPKLYAQIDPIDYVATLEVGRAGGRLDQSR